MSTPAPLDDLESTGLLLAAFASEFSSDDSVFGPVFVRAEGAARAALAGHVASARECGLAELGLAASEDARAAASTILEPLPSPGRLTLAEIAALYPTDPAGAVAAVGESAWSADVPFPLSAGYLAAGPGASLTAAVPLAIANARELATALAIAQDDWQHALVGVRSHASARDLAAIAFGKPVVDARFAMPALGVTLAAAYTAIETLVDRGILVARGPERRNRAWFAPAVLDALDAFAERAGVGPVE